MRLFNISIILFCSVGLFACGKTADIDLKITHVTVFELPEEQNTSKRTFNGISKAHDLVDLAFRVDGKIDNVVVTKGQQVKEGELLAILDKSDYQVAVNDRKSIVDRTLAQYKRGKSMLKKKLMAQAEFDKMEAEYLVADANYKMAKLALKYTELRAPFDGVVSDTFIDSFENVKTGVAILNMHRLDLIEVEVQLPDQVLAMVKLNQSKNIKFKVVFSAYPELEFKGTPYELNLMKDPTTRTYLGVVTVPIRPKYEILQGMPAKLTMDLGDFTGNGEAEYLIPISAVRSVDGGTLQAQTSQVFIYDEQTEKVVMRTVEIGLIVDDFIEVKSGLKSGERVVVDGSARLVDGQQVALIKGEK